MAFLPPGARGNPYPFGKAVTLQHGWRLKVNSAILNAAAEVEAVTDQHGAFINPPPPAGAQYALVNVTVTRVGPAALQLGEYLAEQTNPVSVAADTENYWWRGCTPPPLDLSAVLEVSPGQTETGNLCVEIESDDANTLLLQAQAVTAHTAGRTVYFGLR